MTSVHNDHTLCLHPHTSLESAVDYVRVVESYNVHADNMMSFLGFASPAMAEAKDEMASLLKSYSISLRADLDEAISSKTRIILEAVRSKGLDNPAIVEFYRLFQLFTEFVFAVYVKEQELLKASQPVYVKPSLQLVNDAGYMKALDTLNAQGMNVFFFIIGQEDLSEEQTREIGYRIVEFYRAVRSHQTESIMVTKADLYSIQASRSGEDDTALWDLKSRLDAYEVLVYTVEDAEYLAEARLVSPPCM